MNVIKIVVTYNDVPAAKHSEKCFNEAAGQVEREPFNYYAARNNYKVFQIISTAMMQYYLLLL